MQQLCTHSLGILWMSHKTNGHRSRELRIVSQEESVQKILKVLSARQEETEQRLLSGEAIEKMIHY